MGMSHAGWEKGRIPLRGSSAPALRPPYRWRGDPAGEGPHSTAERAHSPGSHPGARAGRDAVERGRADPTLSQR